MKKISITLVLLLLLTVISTQAVSAHVTVQPAEVANAARQDFSVGVPNEKDIPTVAVRLVLPEGLEGVTPYVKPGWEIETKESGEGESAKITEISWTGGEIAEGLRDAFVFRAMTPSDPTTLIWKAYQTYSDGTVVSWDQEATGEGHGGSEDETKGPYSETKVVTDLSTEPQIEKSALERATPMIASLALLLSALGLGLQLRKRS